MNGTYYYIKYQLYAFNRYPKRWEKSVKKLDYRKCPLKRFCEKKKINAWLFLITQGYTLIEKFKKFKKSVFIAFSVSAYSLVN